MAADPVAFSPASAMPQTSTGRWAASILNSPIVGMGTDALTGRKEKGYYLAGADGGIFAFGDAVFAASARGLVDAPVIGVF